MKKKRLLFIYNPKAGKTVVQKELHTILQFYTVQGYLVTAYPTQCAGDACMFMRNNKDDFDLIVAAGGDGTINEVISGMSDAGIQTPLGYLPMGSTNDFAAGIGLGKDLSRALETSVSGSVTALDTGALNGKSFLYVAAFGLFTDVPYTTAQSLKNSLGYAAYILQGVRELTNVKAIHLNIDTKEQYLEGDYCVGLITNAFSVSGFKNPVSSITRLNDGQLEGIFIGMPQNIFELNSIVSALFSGNPNHSKIQVLQFEEIHIHGEGLSWTLDGEYGGTYDDSIIAVQPQAFQIRVFDDGKLREKLTLPDETNEIETAALPDQRDRDNPEKEQVRDCC